ncbi:MAG: hypothetical protein PHW04_08855 [Candidatus Wallbacteria bacterium]|nr:hypothetical protein [Candidatus Wallbacteria bacterium]
MNGKNEFLETLKEHLEIEINSKGLRILDLENVGKHQIRIVIFIYREDGKPVGVEDCQLVNRSAEDFLDNEQDFPENYSLEVSSPGLSRNLKKECDFQYALSREIEIHLRKPVDGKFSLVGKLKSFNQDGIVLMINGEDRMFSRDGIKTANLFFNWGGKKNGKP